MAMALILDGLFDYVASTFDHYIDSNVAWLL